MKLSKITIIIFLVILGIGLILAFTRNSTQKAGQPGNQNIQRSAENDPPKIISTKPDPLENSIVSATETVEITFNRSLENVGEFKVRIEPKIDYKVELSGDRKTAKIIPVEPYQLGTTYTMFIGPETKFDGVGRWGEEKVFHFRTIKYTGV